MKIGYYIDHGGDYNKVRPSIRLRCYDPMIFLNNNNVHTEIYKESEKYDIVIFLKSFKEKQLKKAEELSKTTTKVVYDIGVNYVELAGEALNYVREDQTEYVTKMLSYSDGVTVSSRKLKEIYDEYHSNVSVIEDAVELRFFDTLKEHTDKRPIKLLYCGIAVKAKDVLLIKDILVKLREEHGIEMIYICEKDPEIDIIPYEFVKYDHAKLPQLLIKGDIKIAPRDLTNSYNWGHSILKVAYPMSVGIPVVASCVPSYVGRGARICNNEKQWYTGLEGYIKSHELRNSAGNWARRVIKENFTTDIMGQNYLDFFKGILN